MYEEDGDEYEYGYNYNAPEDEDNESNKYAEPMGPFEDKLSTDNITKYSFLSSEFASDTERKYFPELTNSRETEVVFLKVRNAALRVWHSCRIKECTVEKVKETLFPDLYTDHVLITRVVNYLTREGLINFGYFKRFTVPGDRIRKERKAVLVIGTGAAGIAAATQLQNFGFNVHLVEAKDRIGGRVSTVATHANRRAEIGCDTLRNIKTSPIFTLAHQLHLETVSTEENQKVYKDGVQHEIKNKLIRVLYRNLQTAIASLKEEVHERSENGLYPSRQRLYENMFNLLERNTLLNYYNYVTKTEELERRKHEHMKRLESFKKVAVMSEKSLNSLPDDDHLARRARKYDIKKAMESFQKEWDDYEKCEALIADHKKSPKVKQYMSPNDFRDYNFLLGYEELRAGTILEKLQFSENTKERELEGPLVRIPTGLMDLFEKIIDKNNLKLRMNQRVMSIDYTDPSTIDVECRCEDRTYSVRTTYVVSTIPLGVLKKTIVNDKKAPIFFPPLPEKKIEAIRCMGFGLINKVILEFNYPFWNPNEMLQFGTVNPTIQERSVFVCWQSVPYSKVITGYYVADQEFNDLDDEEICRRACAVLCQIYPKCPATPESGFVTRWHDDDLAYGSGTFMSLRTEPHHFEDMIEPLKDENGKNRIYFAGEHTSAEHHGTLDGAWLSGIRAATELINDVLGIDLTEERVALPVKEGEDEFVWPVKKDGEQLNSIFSHPASSLAVPNNLRPQRSFVRNSSSFPSLAQTSSSSRPVSLRSSNVRSTISRPTPSNASFNQPSTSGTTFSMPNTSNIAMNRASTSRPSLSRSTIPNTFSNQPFPSRPSTSQPSSSSRPRPPNSASSNSYSNFQYIANQNSFYDRPYIPPSSSSRRRQAPPATEEDFYTEHRVLVPDPKRLH